MSAPPHVTHASGGGRDAARHAHGRAALLVICKTPVPGRVKTRLTPPCTPEQAAALAAASIADTLAAVTEAAGPERRRVLVLDGDRGPWIPAGWEVIPQEGDGLEERLAAAFTRVGGPALLVGMDTPQLSPAVLREGLAVLERSGPQAADSVLGMSEDGGYWVIGLRRADVEVFVDVPMSEDHTGRVQRERLDALGHRVHELPPLLDVDTWTDAQAVARIAPQSRFARALASLGADPLRTVEGVA